MAKLIVLLAAIFCVQAFPYQHEVTDVNEIGKYTRDLVGILKTHYEVDKLDFLKENVEKLIEELNTKHIEDDVVLELRNKFGDLSVNLRKPLEASHRIVEDLDDVWRIFKSISEHLVTGEKSLEVHQLLLGVSNKYCTILERMCTMLSKKTGTTLNAKENVEHALEDILDNLKTMPLDYYIKQVLMNFVHNYVNELEALHDVLRNEMSCFKKIAEAKDINLEDLIKCVEKLLMMVQKQNLNETVYKQLLPATRTLEFNIYNICSTKNSLGETPLGFEVQIQTVANGLINAINTITIENEETHSILHDLVREFVSGIKTINDKLKGRYIYTGMGNVVNDLKHVDATDMNEIKTRLMNAVQKSTMEISNVLRNKRSEEIYGIVSDFLAILQRQTMQIQNIFQSITHNLPLEKLAMQIQTITNGVLLYLRNVPTNDVMIREKLEVQVHHLIKKVNAALDRVRPLEDEELAKTVRKIKYITNDFENFMEKTEMTSIQTVVFHFDILAQKVASGMKQLAWIGKSRDSLNDTVKNLLSEYLVIIENIQVKIQRINQVSQVGESPRELALQIQVLSDHLRKLLIVFITDNRLTKNVLMWQVRCLNEILEVTIEQLQTKGGTIYRDVASNLKNTQQLLQSHLTSDNLNQFKVIIGNVIRKTSIELNKLTVTAHSDIQEGNGVQTTFVRSILMQFLLALQDFHIQIQHNFQIVLSGQTPTKALREVGVLSNKILGLLDKNDVKMEEVLAIQLGEYLQTIENVLNLLHHRMKSNGEHNVEQEKIMDVLGKLSLILQNVNVKNTREVREKLEMCMRKFMNVMQELTTMNIEKVKHAVQGGTHTGILHGALSNMLSTLRNMYLQIQHIKRVPKYEDTHEVINQISVVGNSIMPTLETIVGSTTPIKQALTIQVFKYSRELSRLSKKLESIDPKIKIVVDEALMVLEQTASSIATLTINEMKLHLNKLVQSINKELLNIKNRDVLIEYLMSLKNLHLQIQSISRMSHQSENYQLVGMFIDTAVIELCKSLQNVPTHNKVIAKAIVLESHELAQLIANVINRYQAASVLQKNKLFMEIASELKTVQLHLQELTVRQMSEDFERRVVEVVVYVEKATVLIEELMWMPAPTQTSTSQYKPDIATFIRVTLHDFLTAVQNMVIQVESVLVHVDDNKLGLIQKLNQEKMHSSTHTESTKVLYQPEMELYKGMMQRTQVSDFLITMLKDSYRNLRHMALTKNLIQKYVKHLIVLVEEITQLIPKDTDSQMYVNKMHVVYKNFRNILLVSSSQTKMEFLETVRLFISTSEEFYHKLTTTNKDKHVLVLVKNWIGEFCSVLKHGHDQESTGVLKNIEALTEKVIDALRHKHNYELKTYARNYFLVLHKILDMVPANLVEDFRYLHMDTGVYAKQSFIRTLEMVPRKLEKIIGAVEEHENSMLVKNLLTPYLDCLQRLYGELNVFMSHHY